MRIGVIGTRGIPNNYGGFEQFAEYLSTALVLKGHEVFVYNSDKHSYQEKLYKGVHIIHKFDPENNLGTFGQFIYDFNCIIDSRKRNFDILLFLGYTSSSIWYKFFPKKTIIVTNMDGLEWRRTKFSKSVQKFLLFAEKLAIKNSDYLIADSIGIQTYLRKKYDIDSTYIAYGAIPFENPQESILKRYNLEREKYQLIIARIEPENNIETILDGIYQSSNQLKTIVVGNASNKFGLYLQKKYAHETLISFVGPLYDINILNNLRHFSKYYFHGHSVGGTNPSLLEAMASRSFIIAHDNEFNNNILEEHAYYFKNANDIAAILNEEEINQNDRLFRELNYMKIKNHFTWAHILCEYESFMTKILKK